MAASKPLVKKTTAITEKYTKTAILTEIATNTDLATRMADIIDFDAGPMITGKRTLNELAEDLLELSIQTASGECVPKAVSLGQDDFIPWKRSVSL